MIKLPFTKTGDLKIFEFIKITLIISLFVVGISMIFTKSLGVITLTPVTLSITYTMFVAQLFISAYQILKDIYNLVKKYVIKIVIDTCQEIKFNFKNNTIEYKEEILPVHKKHIRLSVIRCWYFFLSKKEENIERRITWQNLLNALLKNTKPF